MLDNLNPLLHLQSLRTRFRSAKKDTNTNETILADSVVLCGPITNEILTNFNQINTKINIIIAQASAGNAQHQKQVRLCTGLHPV